MSFRSISSKEGHHEYNLSLHLGGSNISAPKHIEMSSVGLCNRWYFRNKECDLLQFCNVWRSTFRAIRELFKHFDFLRSKLLWCKNEDVMLCSSLFLYNNKMKSHVSCVICYNSAMCGCLLLEPLGNSLNIFISLEVKYYDSKMWIIYIMLFTFLL